MSNYTLVNLVAVAITVGVAVLLRTRRRIVRTAKLSLLAPLLSFPWLHFGITQEAWGHTDPGPIFMSVPLNELVLTFLMTFASAGVLLLNYRAILEEAGRRANAKDRASHKE